MTYLHRLLHLLPAIALPSAGCELAPCSQGDYYAIVQQMTACLESSAQRSPVNQYGVNCSAIAHYVDDNRSLEACVGRVWEEEGCPSDCNLGVVGKDESTLADAWSAICETSPAIAEIRCETTEGLLVPASVRVPTLPGFEDVPF